MSEVQKNVLGIVEKKCQKIPIQVGVLTFYEM